MCTKKPCTVLNHRNNTYDFDIRKIYNYTYFFSSAYQLHIFFLFLLSQYLIYPQTRISGISYFLSIEIHFLFFYLDSNSNFLF